MERSFKSIAKEAKSRLKQGFWKTCQEERTEKIAQASAQGANESRAQRYFTDRVVDQIKGKKKDDFYERVKEMLLSEGEVSDALGRLTDHEYYDSLTYEEKQRYTLQLSERYLRALERFKKECEFELKK